MSHNVFGHLFRVTTFGESHGPGIGCVVDGCPPRIPLDAADIQADLDRRRPGASRFTTQRREPDEVKILSGVMVDGRIGRSVTTGAPIGLFIENVDQRSKDYSEIKDKYRPGHADFTYEAKYGIRDYRGGGRSSARETAARVAAGAIARKVVAGVTIRGALVQIGKHRIDRGNWDWEEVDRNPFFCPDAKAAALFADYLDEVRKSGSSIGAVIEIVAEGRAGGLGRADLRQARQRTRKRADEHQRGQGRRNRRRASRAAELSGEENADEMRMGADGRPVFLANHAGGILGGISTGQPIVARFAVKPTSSILSPRRTINQRRRGHRDRHQGAPRPLCRHQGGAGRRGDGRLRSRRRVPAPSRPGRLSRKPARKGRSTPPHPGATRT